MKHFISIVIISFALFSCKNNQEQKTVTANQPSTASHPDSLKPKVVDFIFNKDSVIANGESVQRYKNGTTKMSGLMKNGKREGLWKSFYENGKPWSETTFSNGIKNGKTTTWFTNGQKRYEGFYTNDKESGKWTVWDEKGKIVTKKDYGN